jgi:hypothetical protein
VAALIFRTRNRQLWTPTELDPDQLERYFKTGGIGDINIPLAPGTLPPSFKVKGNKDNVDVNKKSTVSKSKTKSVNKLSTGSKYSK